MCKDGVEELVKYTLFLQHLVQQKTGAAIMAQHMKVMMDEMSSSEEVFTKLNKAVSVMTELGDKYDVVLPGINEWRTWSKENEENNTVSNVD